MKEKYLVALGTNCIDEYYEMEEDPVMGEKVLCKALGAEVGGMIGNAAAVYSAYGRPTYMVDFMNNGSQAQRLKEDMTAYGIDTGYLVEAPSLPDPKCLIMLKDGERIIFVVANYKKDLLLPAPHRALFAGAEYVYSTLVEVQALQNYQEIVAEFRQKGAKLVLDVEDNTINHFTEDWKLLLQTDILFINTSGHRKLTELAGEGYYNQLVSAGGIVVHTLGAKGCRVYAKNQPPIEVKAYPVVPVDTTGAGDTFNASFLYALSEGQSLEESARFAGAAAARAIGLHGPRSGAVNTEKVMEFIQQKKES